MTYHMGDDILPAWMPGSQRGRQRNSSPWRFALYAIACLAAYQGLVIVSRVCLYSYFTMYFSDVSFNPPVFPSPSVERDRYREMFWLGKTPTEFD